MKELSAVRRAYDDVLKSKLIQDSVVRKHVEKYAELDALAPRHASFFYIIELATGLYRFLGKQQEVISGIKNEEFASMGISAFLSRLHPDEVDVIINEVYRDMVEWFSKLAGTVSRGNLVIQYNYRFLNKEDSYVNLMEHVYCLEVDNDGKPSLLLGNVILLGEGEAMPLRCVLNVYRGEMIETIYSKTYSSIISRYRLTVREIDVLRNLAKGKSSKEIATQLFISPNTVDTHRRNLLKKLNCSSVVAMARIAYEAGLI